LILSFKVTRDLTFVVAEDSVGFNEQSCRQNSQTGGDADDQPVLAEVGVDQVTANMKYIGIVTMNVFLFSFLSHAAIASRDRAASIWFAVPKIGQIVR